MNRWGHQHNLSVMKFEMPIRWAAQLFEFPDGNQPWNRCCTHNSSILGLNWSANDQVQRGKARCRFMAVLENDINIDSVSLATAGISNRQPRCVSCYRRSGFGIIFEDGDVQSLPLLKSPQVQYPLLDRSR